MGLQGCYEDLLMEHQVDLVLAGHYHSYLRSSKIYQDKRVEDDQKGIYHFTVGSAGASVDFAPLYVLMRCGAPRILLL